MKQRATALTNAQMLDQLCNLLIPKLEQRLANLLPSKPSAEGITGVGHLVAELKPQWTPFYRHLSKFAEKLLSTKSIIEPQNV